MIASEPQSQLKDVDSRIAGLKLTPIRLQHGVQEITLGEGICRIGSSSECDVRLEAAGVAERHCEIQFANGAATVKPIDPKTWLNEGPVRRRPLRPNDRLALGPVEFTVSFVSESTVSESTNSTSASVDTQKPAEPVAQQTIQSATPSVPSGSGEDRQQLSREDVMQSRLEQFDQHVSDLQLACQQAINEPTPEVDQESEKQGQAIAARQQELDELEKSLREQLAEISNSREEIQAGVQSIHAQKEELKGLDQTLHARLQEIEAQQQEIVNRNVEITQLKSEVEESRKQFESERQAIETERLQLEELKVELEKGRNELEESKVAIEPPQFNPESIAIPDAVRVSPVREAEDIAAEEPETVELSDTEAVGEVAVAVADLPEEVQEATAVEASSADEQVKVADPDESPSTDDLVDAGFTQSNDEELSFDEFDAIGDTIGNMLAGEAVQDHVGDESRSDVEEEVQDFSEQNFVDHEEAYATEVEDQQIEESSVVSDDLNEEPNEGKVTELRSQLADMFGIPAENSATHQEVEPAPAPVVEPTTEETPSEQPSSGLFSERFLKSEPAEETPTESTAVSNPTESTFDTPASSSADQSTLEETVEPEPEEEEDSVAAYMKQLLARSNSSQQPEPEVQSPQRRRETYSRPSAIADDSRQDANGPESGHDLPAEPPRPKREKPDVDKDAVRRDMDSFRELANMSARSAVAKHSSKKIRIKLLLNLILAVASFGLALVLVITSLVTDKAYFVYAILSALVGLMTGFELLRSSILSKRSRKVKKPTQEALAEVQSELDSYEETEV